MKMYAVHKGTSGILITHNPHDQSVSQKDWTVRKDFVFSDEELVIDPVRLHNAEFNGNPVPETYESNLAARGYAVFTPRETPRYSLAVKYTDIEVC